MEILLKKKIGWVHLIRNYGQGFHANSDCCERMRFDRRIFPEVLLYDCLHEVPRNNVAAPLPEPVPEAE